MIHSQPCLVTISLSPLKSGKAQRVTDGRIRIGVTPLGFADDRQFMLVDAASSVAVTQRQLPALCQVGLTSFNKSMILSYRGEQLNIRIAQSASALLFAAKLHGERVKVLEVDPRISEWLSNRLGSKVLLVKKAKTFKRTAGFQDAASFLLLSEATFEYLN